MLGAKFGQRRGTGSLHQVEQRGKVTPQRVDASLLFRPQLFEDRFLK